jgi:transposase
MDIAAALILREGDRGRLEALVRSASARPSLSQRAQIVLMAAEGLTNTEIARRTGSTRPTVINWRKRYAAGGINALGDLPRSGRPAVVDELEVVATTLADGGCPPPHLGVSHWSSRLLGQHLGISFTTVSRIWRKWGIQPDHVETFTFGTDLQAQARAHNLSGLHFNLSQRAAELQRALQASIAEGAPATAPDPWRRLVEVSLGIITQQAIRRGTFTSVRDLIETLGALTGGGADRQTTSDTNLHLHKRSSRSVESGLSWDRERDLERSASRTRDSKSVRAEFHGARGRRSPTVPPHRGTPVPAGRS